MIVFRWFGSVRRARDRRWRVLATPAACAQRLTVLRFNGRTMIVSRWFGSVRRARDGRCRVLAIPAACAQRLTGTRLRRGMDAVGLLMTRSCPKFRDSPGAVGKRVDFKTHQLSDA